MEMQSSRVIYPAIQRGSKLLAQTSKAILRIICFEIKCYEGEKKCCINCRNICST